MAVWVCLGSSASIMLLTALVLNPPHLHTLGLNTAALYIPTQVGELMAGCDHVGLTETLACPKIGQLTLDPLFLNRSQPGISTSQGPGRRCGLQAKPASPHGNRSLPGWTTSTQLPAKSGGRWVRCLGPTPTGQIRMKLPTLASPKQR